MGWVTVLKLSILNFPLKYLRRLCRPLHRQVLGSQLREFSQRRGPTQSKLNGLVRYLLFNRFCLEVKVILTYTSQSAVSIYLNSDSFFE